MTTPTCLIVVDVQNGFICPATATLPQRIRTFLEQRHFDHRIFTRFINPGEGSRFVNVFNWSSLQSDEEIALASEVATLPTLVVDKHTFSPVVKTDLVIQLKRFKIQTVFVCGLDTDVCVLATASALFDYNFQVKVITDLCMSTAGEAIHQAALQILPRIIGRQNLVTTSQLTI